MKGIIAEVRRGRRFVHTYVTVLLLAVAGFLALAVLAGGHQVLAVDVAVTRAVQGLHPPLYGWVLTHVSDLGYGLLSPLTFVAVFVPLFALGLRLEAILAVLSAGVAGLVGGALKLLIARARPSAALVHVARPLHGYGFPSGHVIHYTVLFGFAGYVGLVAWRRSPLRDLVLVLLALLVALVGPSRVYLGAHWPTDVLGAYLLAGMWLAGTIALHRALTPRLGIWWARPARRTPAGACTQRQREKAVQR